MSELIKVKDRYIRKSDITSFWHVADSGIQENSAAADYLMIILRDGNTLSIKGPEDLAGQLAKHFETPENHKPGDLAIASVECTKCHNAMHVKETLGKEGDLYMVCGDCPDYSSEVIIRATDPKEY